MDSIISERRISDKAFLGQYVLAVGAGIGIAVGCFMMMAILAPLAVLPVVAVFLHSRLVRAGNSYRLYGDRLEIEAGLLSRKIENIELFRIRDVGLRQGLLGRMGDFGDVYIHSTDSSTPDLHVRAIDNPRGFYQELRTLVTQSRAGTRTVIMENADSLPEP